MTYRNTLAVGLVFLSGTLAETIAHAETPSPTEQRTGEPSLKTVGWYVTAGGGVTLVGSAVMFALHGHQSTELEKEAKAGNFDAAASTRHQLEVYHSLGWALLAVGSVGVATGLTLVVLSPKDHENATRVTLGLDRVAVMGTF